jgi:hypothetical protein
LLRLQWVSIRQMGSLSQCDSAAARNLIRRGSGNDRTVTFV